MGLWKQPKQDFQMTYQREFHINTIFKLLALDFFLSSHKSPVSETAADTYVFTGNEIHRYLVSFKCMFILFCHVSFSCKYLPVLRVWFFFASPCQCLQFSVKSNVKILSIIMVHGVQVSIFSEYLPFLSFKWHFQGR